MFGWYVLVLTLAGGTTQSGQAIDHIRGFGTLEQCQAAGDQWLAQMKATSAQVARAVCLHTAAK